MTLMRETPKDYGLLVDHDPKGNRRLSVTLAGKSPRKNGRRLQYATGALYNRSFQHVSTILWNHHGQRLQPQEGGWTTIPSNCRRSRGANPAVAGRRGRYGAG